jgi:hypothetical protein
MKNLDIPKEGLRLLYLTDLHLSGSRLLRKRDALVLRTVAALTDRARPHLTVLGGDFLSPIFTRSFSGNSYRQAVLLGEFMEGLRLPWCALPGNHDGQGNAPLSEVFSHFSRLPSYLDLPLAPARGRNSVLSLCHEGRAVHRLFLMDTHTRRRRAWAWDHVGGDQITWFQKEAEGLPSTVLCHVPPLALSLQNGRKNVTEHGFVSAMAKAGTRLLLAGHHHGAHAMHNPSPDLLLAYNPTMDHTVSPFSKKRRHGASLLTFLPDGGATLCRFWCQGGRFWQDEPLHLPFLGKITAKI